MGIIFYQINDYIYFVKLKLFTLSAIPPTDEEQKHKLKPYSTNNIYAYQILQVDINQFKQYIIENMFLIVKKRLILSAWVWFHVSDWLWVNVRASLGQNCCQ